MSRRIISNSVFIFTFTSGAAALPLLASAQTIGELLKKIQTGILTPFISLLFVLATAVFLWGVIQYVIGSQGDQKKLDQGKQVMLWGIIGMFIMVSAWGVIRVLCNFFGPTACVGVNFPTR